MAVLSTLYVDVIARGFADVNRQVSSLSQSMQRANAVSQQMGRSGAGGMAGGMQQAAGSAGMMSRAAMMLGPALAVAAVGVAAIGAAWKLVHAGMQGTVELFRSQFAFQQFARSFAGTFTPVFNQITTMWTNLTKALDNNSGLRMGMYVGLVVPMQLFVKSLEAAVRLMAALAGFTFRLAAVVANLGGLGGDFAPLMKKLVEHGKKKQDVTLMQTGEESAQGTFARIQEAILKLSVKPPEDPLQEIMDAIDKKVGNIEKMMGRAGDVVENNPQIAMGAAVNGAFDAAPVVGMMAGIPGAAAIGGLLNLLRR